MNPLFGPGPPNRSRLDLTTSIENELRHHFARWPYEDAFEEDEIEYVVFDPTPLVFEGKEPDSFFDDEGGTPFRGQEEEKQRILTYINVLRRNPEDRFKTLLSGRAGTGKTTLARIIAKYIREARVQAGLPTGNYYEVLPTQIRERDQMAGLVKTLEPYDIVFFDEVHAIANIEDLFHVLHDTGAPRYPLSDGTWVDVDRSISWITATTDPGMLDKYAEGALRRRLEPEIVLSPYKSEELVEILMDQEMPIEFETAKEIVSRSGAFPWQLKTIFREAKNVCLVSDEKIITDAHAERAFQMMKLDKNGLFRQDRDVIAALLKTPHTLGSGKTIYRNSRSAICAIVGIDAITFEKRVKPKLMTLGYLTTAWGHQLTDKAVQDYAHLKEA